MTITIWGMKFCLAIIAICMVASILTEHDKKKWDLHPLLINWIVTILLYLSVSLWLRVFNVIDLLDFWRFIQVIIVTAIINIGYKGGTSGYDFLANFISFLPRRKK